MRMQIVTFLFPGTTYEYISVNSGGGAPFISKQNEYKELFLFSDKRVKEGLHSKISKRVNTEI